MGPLIKCYAIAALALMVTMMVQPCLGSFESKYQRPFSSWKVGIINKLSGVQTLTVHCKSKDDDLGEHVLNSGQSYQWSFEENWRSSTLYWCSFKTPTNLHATFEVFWPEKHEWLASRCNFSSCIWVAQDDGIYLMNIPAGSLELVHSWEH